ncbi:MAG: LacI family DNA-binding transcriptional regulator [Anaerolineae bacterium]
MRKLVVTAQQVAKKAGVSQTTVSFVLNNVEGANISEATRDRVLQAAHELGYVPAAAARNLAKGMSSNLALVLFKPHAQVFLDPYVPNVITGFSRVAKQNGFRLLVEEISDVDEVGVMTQLLRGGEAAGIVSSGSSPQYYERLHDLVNDGYPILSLDPDPIIPSVAIDHPNGVRSAIAHLVGLGHREIACITYAPISDHPNTDVSRRLRAYQGMLSAHGIEPDDRLIRLGNYDPESGYEAARSLLEAHPNLTAIYGMNDLMALGAMRAIHESGRRIPEDIAVIGYDDMRFTPFTSPPLTTVHAPEIELGARAAEVLIHRIKEQSWEGSLHLLSTHLVIRDSCGGKRPAEDPVIPFDQSVQP